MRDLRKVDIAENGLQRCVTMQEVREFVAHLSFLPGEWQVRGYLETTFPTDLKFDQWPLL